MFFEVLGIEIMTQTHLEKFQPLSIDKMNAFLWPEIALFCQQAKKIWYKLNSPHPHHDVWKSLKLYHLKMGKTKLVHSNVDFWRENSKFYVQLVLLTKFFFQWFSNTVTPTNHFGVWRHLWTPSQITWEPIWLFPKGANQIMSSDNTKFATLTIQASLPTALKKAVINILTYWHLDIMHNQTFKMYDSLC